MIIDTSQLNSNSLSTPSTTPPVKRLTPKSCTPTPSPPPSQQKNSVNVQESAHSNHSAQIVSNGSPGSPPTVSASEIAKRRRFNSSPVRPWKSPSPPPSVGSVNSVSSPPSSNSTSSLLRHISVIRETPPILKPQVVSPAYHPHAHHYHPLVDPYAAAYHLYKNGSAGHAGGMGAPATPSGHHQHWGAYN